MRIKLSIPECADLIIGAYGSSSFYNSFDKHLYKNDIFIRAPINNDKLYRLSDLLTKIQSHWNKQNTKDLIEFSNQNTNSFNQFLNYPENNYKNFIMLLNIKGVKNTKISKIIHVLKPNLFPMLDPLQGEFLVNGYDNNSRCSLILAIDSFYKHFKETENYQKTQKIKMLLGNSYSIRISNLRVFELLIWLQTQMRKKGIKRNIF